MKLQTPITLMLLLSMAMAVSACDSCSKPKDPPKTKPKPKVDVKPKEVKKDPPKEDPLKEAKAKAEEVGTTVAMTVTDRAVLVASEIEAASKQTTATTTRPKIRKTSSKYTGKIDPKAANKVFRDFNIAMKRCYERALKRNRGLEGKVLLSVRVSPEGKVAGAKASPVSMRDGMVFKCMETLTKKMKFPKPDGGMALVRKTYTFRPDQ